MVLSGYPGFFTTTTGRHDIAEILLKVALKTINQSISPLPKGDILGDGGVFLKKNQGQISSFLSVLNYFGLCTSLILFEGYMLQDMTVLHTKTRSL